LIYNMRLHGSASYSATTIVNIATPAAKRTGKRKISEPEL